MTKTEYQQHLLEEYASYLRKAIANKKENYEMTPQQLASALLKAFEKGATKGILYESQNDVEKVESFVKKPTIPRSESVKQTETEKQISKDDVNEALELLASIFAQSMSGKL